MLWFDLVINVEDIIVFADLFEQDSIFDHPDATTSYCDRLLAPCV